MLAVNSIGANTAQGIQNWWSLGGEGVGQVTMEFLKRPLSARALAMGGRLGMLEQGAFASGENPAGLAFVSPFAYGFSHEEILSEFRHEVFAITLPSFFWFLGGTSGVSINALTSGAIEGRDVDGYSTQDFSQFDGALSFSSGYRILKTSWAIGWQLTGLRGQIEEEVAWGFSSSFGVVKELGLSHRWGIAVHHLSPGVQYTEHESTLEALPQSFTFEWGKLPYFSPLGYSLGLTLNNEGNPKVFGGAEWTFASFLALRGGYERNWRERELDGWAGLSIGTGVSFQGFELDYALHTLAPLGWNHHLTLNYTSSKKYFPLAEMFRRAQESFKDKDWKSCRNWLNQILERSPRHGGALELQRRLNRRHESNRVHLFVTWSPSFTEAVKTPKIPVALSHHLVQSREQKIHALKKEYPGGLFWDGGVPKVRAGEPEECKARAPLYQSYSSDVYDAILGENWLLDSLCYVASGVSEEHKNFSDLPWFRLEAENFSSKQANIYTSVKSTGSLNIGVYRAESLTPDYESRSILAKEVGKGKWDVLIVIAPAISEMWKFESKDSTLVVYAGESMYQIGHIELILDKQNKVVRHHVRTVPLESFQWEQVVWKSSPNKRGAKKTDKASSPRPNVSNLFAFTNFTNSTNHSNKSRKTHLYIKDLKTNFDHRLSQPCKSVTSLAWSPNQEHIAFACKEGQKTSIYKHQIKTRKEFLLWSSNRVIQELYWGENEEQLLVGTQSGPFRKFGTLEKLSTNETHESPLVDPVLWNGTGQVWKYHRSPRGENQRIAVEVKVKERGNTHEIWINNQFVAEGVSLKWSPGGRFLGYWSPSRGVHWWDLWVYDVRTQESKKVLSRLSSFALLNWDWIEENTVVYNGANGLGTVLYKKGFLQREARPLVKNTANNISNSNTKSSLTKGNVFSEENPQYFSWEGRPGVLYERHFSKKSRHIYWVDSQTGNTVPFVELPGVNRLMENSAR